jgi:hypothetical protein
MHAQIRRRTIPVMALPCHQDMNPLLTPKFRTLSGLDIFSENNLYTSDC